MDNLFWDRFYNACAQKGTKPNPVAKEIGISSGIVTKWKNNGTVPNGETLTKIADYLGCSVDYLLGRDAEPEEKTLDEQLEGIEFALFGEVKELTDEQKRDILNYAKFVKSRDKNS